MSHGSRFRREKVPLPPSGYKKKYCEICGNRENQFGKYDKDGYLIHKRCGSTRLTIHHIDHNPYNNDPNNLQTLCATCHINIHRNEDHSKPKTP